MKLAMKLSTLFVFLYCLAVPAVALAQDAASEEPTTIGYIALACNLGVIAAVVQLLKWCVMPWLKTKAPYLIPLIAMAVGWGSTFILQETGIDIKPIVDLFGPGLISGAFAATAFAVAKGARKATTGELVRLE